MTLRDFKAAVDRQGSFRYHFKSLDPEFGTVKEEVGLGVNYSLFLSKSALAANLNSNSIIITAAAAQNCCL